jgi:hypothetical protein
MQQIIFDVIIPDLLRSACFAWLRPIAATSLCPETPPPKEQPLTAADKGWRYFGASSAIVVLPLHSPTNASAWTKEEE